MEVGSSGRQPTQRLFISKLADKKPKLIAPLVKRPLAYAGGWILAVLLTLLNVGVGQGLVRHTGVLLGVPSLDVTKQILTPTKKSGALLHCILRVAWIRQTTMPGIRTDVVFEPPACAAPSRCTNTSSQDNGQQVSRLFAAILRCPFFDVLISWIKA
jgi:hypothetical protein